jgi:hypothetical protein
VASDERFAPVLTIPTLGALSSAQRLASGAQASSAAIRSAARPSP